SRTTNADIPTNRAVAANSQVGRRRVTATKAPAPSPIDAADTAGRTAASRKALTWSVADNVAAITGKAGRPGSTPIPCWTAVVMWAKPTAFRSEVRHRYFEVSQPRGTGSLFAA